MHPKPGLLHRQEPRPKQERFPKRELVLKLEGAEQRAAPELAGRVEVGQVEVGQVEVGRVEVGQVEVGRVEAGRAEVGRAEVGRAEVGVNLRLTKFGPENLFGSFWR
jgi:hypothetical protein